MGARNIEMVELAHAHGFAAKFTGSGGACVCLRRPAAAAAPAAAEGAPPAGAGAAARHPLELSEAEEAAVRSSFARLGCSFVRVQLDVDGAEGGAAALEASRSKPAAETLRGAVLQID